MSEHIIAGMVKYGSGGYGSGIVEWTNKVECKSKKRAATSAGIQKSNIY